MSNTTAVVWYYDRVDVAIGVVLMLISILGTISNYWMVHVLIAKLRNERHGFSVLLIQLAASDLINCAFTSPTVAFALLNKRKLPQMLNPVLIDIIGYSSQAMPLISLYLICIICIVRLVGIAAPLFYNSVTEFRNLAVLSGIGWFSALLYSATPFFAGTHYVYHDEVCIITFSVASHMLKISEAVETLMHFITLLAIDLPTLTSMVCCVVIFFKLNHSKINRKRIPGQKKAKKQNNKRKEAAHTTLLIIVAFILCYIPSTIIRLFFFAQTLKITSFSILPPQTNYKARVTFFYVYFITNFFTITLNSILNPVIYLSRAYSDRLNKLRIDILVTRVRLARWISPNLTHTEQREVLSMTEGRPTVKTCPDSSRDELTRDEISRDFK